MKTNIFILISSILLIGCSEEALEKLTYNDHLRYCAGTEVAKNYISDTLGVETYQIGNTYDNSIKTFIEFVPVNDGDKFEIVFESNSSVACINFFDYEDQEGAYDIKLGYVKIYESELGTDWTLIAEKNTRGFKYQEMALEVLNTKKYIKIQVTYISKYYTYYDPKFFISEITFH